jgi:hypothetical protein
MSILRRLINKFSSTVKVEEVTGKVLAPLIGKPVLFRCNRKGVQVGILKDTDSQFFYLSPSRKLWYWHAKEGLALESLAKTGVRANNTRATSIVDFDAIRLDDICGAIMLTESIYDSIMSLEVSKQS